MTQIILRQDLEKSKLDALVAFLKSWNVDMEVKTNAKPKGKAKTEFSLSVGLWKNYVVDAKELRNKAWTR